MFNSSSHYVPLPMLFYTVFTNIFTLFCEFNASLTCGIRRCQHTLCSVLLPLPRRVVQGHLGPVGPVGLQDHLGLGPSVWLGGAMVELKYAEE